MQLMAQIRDCFPRAEKRFATLASVDIMSEQGALLAKATLRDISATGGKLHVNGSPDLPDQFIMRIAKLGQDIEASLRWRSGNRAGVLFEEDVDLEIFRTHGQSRAKQVAKYFDRPEPEMAAVAL